MADKKDKILEGELTALSLPVEDIETVSDDYAPEGFKTQEEYLEDLRETYQLDINADQDNRDAAYEDKKFTAGDQWDPVVLQQRQGLPCLTINTIPQFTAQLVGDWRENKVGVKVLPAENGDKNVADIRSDLMRSIEAKSRAERVYNDCFESMVQCGDGAFRVSVQYAGEDVFDQEIVIRPIDDALSVVWDRLHIDPTGRDANHAFVDDLMPRKEFEARWPEAAPSNLRDKEERMLTTTGWLDTDFVRVTEHWRMIERKRTLVLFKDGTIFDMDRLKQDVHADDIEKFVADHGGVVKMRIAPCTYAQMHLTTGWKILAGPYEWKMTRLPIIRMAGRTVTLGDGQKVRYGLVRYTKDLIRLKNFNRSIAAEQLGYAPKAQWLAPESAVEGREDLFRKAHLTRDPLLIYNDDAESPPERIEPPTPQNALLQEAQVYNQDMKDVTGIHDASLGIPSNETSGKAIQARQREGDVASLTYYDNGNAAILECGDVVNQLIGQIYDGTRIIRIIGEDESAKLVNINDPMDPDSPNIATGLYDVAITTGPAYTTRRLEAADAMMNAIQVFPEMMGIAGDLVVKAQDWPGAEEIAERMLKAVPPQYLSDKEKSELGDQGNMQGMMQQQAQMGQQLQDAMQKLQQLDQENQLLKAKDAANEAENKIKAYDAETKRLEAYAALLKDNLSMNLEQLESEADIALRGDMQQHQKDMNIANLLQQGAHKNAEIQQSAEQADQDRQFQSAQNDADRAQAQSAAGSTSSPSE